MLCAPILQVSKQVHELEHELELEVCRPQGLCLSLSRTRNSTVFLQKPRSGFAGTNSPLAHGRVLSSAQAPRGDYTIGAIGALRGQKLVLALLAVSFLVSSLV